MTACDVPAQHAGHVRPRGLFRPARLRARSGVALAAMLAVGACDVPTGLPIFESRWVVPLETTQVSVSELLPDALIVVNGEFRIAIPPATAQRTLGVVCGTPCVALQGLQAPKPAFTDSFVVTTAMPSDVVSAMVTGGAVLVTLLHRFDFDPLRPAGSTENGTITLTLRNDGRIVGTAVIDQPFPRDVPISSSVALNPGALSGPIEMRVVLSSPAGAAVTIDNAAVLTVTLAPGIIASDEAQIAVQQQLIASQPSELDLTGVDGELRDRVRRGSLQLVVDNPFDVAGELQLRLQAATSGADISRSVAVLPGASAQTVELTLDELRALLGHRVTAGLGGRVSATAQAVTVRPGQEVTVAPRLDLVLEIGS
jgi:hypothetical protein